MEINKKNFCNWPWLRQPPNSQSTRKYVGKKSPFIQRMGIVIWAILYCAGTVPSSSAKASPHVSLTEQGSLLVGGKPFLPLFVWNQPAKLLTQWRDLGINTIVPGEKPEIDPPKTYLDQLHSAGMIRKEATFISVIDPYKALDVVRSVKPLNVNGPVRAEGVKVKRNDGGTDLIVVRYDPQSDGEPAAPSSFSEGETDALVSVIRRDRNGKIIFAKEMGGSESRATN